MRYARVASLFDGARETRGNSEGSRHGVMRQEVGVRCCADGEGSAMMEMEQDSDIGQLGM